MSSRRQFDDCYTNHYVSDVTADSSASGTASSATFDTSDCYSPSVNVRIASIANNKNLKLKLQHSNTNTSADFVDVPAGVQTNLDNTKQHGAVGNVKAYYAGEMKYIRVVVTSVEASPAATVRVLFQRHNLVSKPNNTPI